MSVDVSELNSLFAPTFCEECYSFDEIKLKVLSSPTSATDVGQTGIVVWRASKLLSLFIARHLPFFARRHVLELGCGAAALCGLTAATSAASVVLTDGEDNVVAKANENISLNHPTTFVSAHRLLWGDDATLSAITSGKFGPIDIVIGADICVWEDALPSLFRTYSTVLRRHPRFSGQHSPSYPFMPPLTSSSCPLCGKEACTGSRVACLAEALSGRASSFGLLCFEHRSLRGDQKVCWAGCRADPSSRIGVPPFNTGDRCVGVLEKCRRERSLFLCALGLASTRLERFPDDTFALWVLVPVDEPALP